MKTLSINFLLLFFITGCTTASISKVYMELSEPETPFPFIEVFPYEPNIKYDHVCDLRGRNLSLSPNSLKRAFQKKARKCGANGIILGHSFGDIYTAKGILYKKQETAKLIDKEKIEAFYLSVQSKNLDLIKEILKDVNKDQSIRALSDDKIINKALYIATLKGVNCDKRIINLLEKEYGGKITKFNLASFLSHQYSDSNIPLCRNVVARSFPKMKNKSNAIIEINNHYVSLLNYNSYDKELDLKAGKYTELLKVSAYEIAAECDKSLTNPICALKGFYLDFANKTKSVKLTNIKNNSNIVLSILSRVDKKTEIAGLKFVE